MPISALKLSRQPHLVALLAALCAALGAGALPAAELMQAGIVSGASVQLKSVAIPTPSSGEVRIRVRAASVNPVDWKLAARGGAEGHIAGRDLAGVIDALGPGVTGWKVGDAVIAVASSGSYAEYALAPVHAIAAKPARWSFNEAAGLPVVGETAWRAMVTVANVQPGQRVLVQGGAGGVGSMAVQIAHDRGALVSATASVSNAEFLRSIGASEVIDYHSVRFEERLHDLDVVLNTVDPDTGLRSMKVIRPGGILVSVVGAPEADACAAAHIRCAITGSVTGQMLPFLVDLANAGKLRVSVERVLPLSSAAQAWELSRAGHTRGKVILQIGGGTSAARDSAG
jgi:NADPH:quinone reductase-like Zn-dependent oxidoreductase